MNYQYTVSFHWIPQKWIFRNHWLLLRHELSLAKTKLILLFLFFTKRYQEALMRNVSRPHFQMKKTIHHYKTSFLGLRLQLLNIFYFPYLLIKSPFYLEDLPDKKIFSIIKYQHLTHTYHLAFYFLQTVLHKEINMGLRTKFNALLF